MLKSTIQVATFGINAGFNGTKIFGNQIAGLADKVTLTNGTTLGKDLIGSTLLKGTEIMTTNITTSAISSMDFSHIGKSGFFNTDNFVQGAFGKGAMTSVGIGMAGKFAQVGSNNVLMKLTNTTDVNKFSSLTGMIGGLTSTSASYAMTGNASVNLLSASMFQSLGLKDKSGGAINTGLFELSFGKNGMHGALSMGGTDVSVGSIALAMSDVKTAYSQYKEIESAKQSAAVQAMLQNIKFGNGDNVSFLQLGADTAGKDALDKMMNGDDEKLQGFVNPFAKQDDSSLNLIDSQPQNLASITNDAKATQPGGKIATLKDMANASLHGAIDYSVISFFDMMDSGISPVSKNNVTFMGLPMGRFGGIISDKANSMKTSMLSSAAKQFLGIDFTSLALDGTVKGLDLFSKSHVSGEELEHLQDFTKVIKDPVAKTVDAIKDPEKAKADQQKLIESYKYGAMKKGDEKPEQPTETPIILNAKALSESKNFIYDGSDGVDNLFYHFTGGYDFSSLIPSDSGSLSSMIVDGLKAQNYGLQLGYSVGANGLLSNLNIGAELLTRMTNPGNVFTNYAQTGSAYRALFSVSMPKINTHVYAKFTYPGSFVELGLGYEYRW